jgi:hypothetical protein
LPRCTQLFHHKQVHTNASEINEDLLRWLSRRSRRPILILLLLL